MYLRAKEEVKQTEQKYVQNNLMNYWKGKERQRKRNEER